MGSALLLSAVRDFMLLELAERIPKFGLAGTSRADVGVPWAVYDGRRGR